MLALGLLLGAPAFADERAGTVLHPLGIDHEKLTYRYNGRNFRLTDVAGDVVRMVLV